MLRGNWSSGIPGYASKHYSRITFRPVIVYKLDNKLSMSKHDTSFSQSFSSFVETIAGCHGMSD